MGSFYQYVDMNWVVIIPEKEPMEVLSGRLFEKQPFYDEECPRSLKHVWRQKTGRFPRPDAGIKRLMERRSIMRNTAEIWYLFHSGYAVKYGSRLMIFDYYNNRSENRNADLAGGIFDPRVHSEEEIFVFASHRHGDHFNPVILNWEKQHPKVHYILSDDIPFHGKSENVLSVSPEKTYTFCGLTIQTLASTDEGVAFLVKIDDFTIYHAGDLHWWHWDGEPDPWNPDMERKYKEQIAKLKNVPIDVAFVPADPRQEKFSHLGISWFLQEVSCPHVFPMHFGKDYSIMEALINHPQMKPWLSRIHPVSQRGQSVVLKPQE